MGRPANKLVGKEYGSLTVKARAGSDGRGQALWLVECKCGNQCIKRGLSLTTGDTVSCGFLCPYSPIRNNGGKRKKPKESDNG